MLGLEESPKLQTPRSDGINHLYPIRTSASDAIPGVVLDKASHFSQVAEFHEFIIIRNPSVPLKLRAY